MLRQNRQGDGRIDFPRNVDQITTGWLTELLCQGVDAQQPPVNSFEYKSIGDGLGAWSGVYRLRIEYDGPQTDLPGSIVVKTGWQSDEVIENSFLRTGIASINERESRFYKELASDCGIAVPTHYFSWCDTETAEAMFLLEDCGHLRTVEQTTDCSINDGRAALLALAKMHSRWWECERLGDYDWLRSYGANAWPQFVQQSLEASIDPFVEIANGSVPTGIENIARKLQSELLGVSDEIAEAPVTLVHGDYRVGNLFFDDSKVEASAIVAFDWQTSGRVRCADDVAYFMATSFDTPSRRLFEQQLLAEYHEALVAGGVVNYSYQELQDDIRVALLLVMARRINSTARAMDTIQSSDDGRDREMVMVKRLQMVVDWNSEEVLLG